MSDGLFEIPTADVELPPTELPIRPEQARQIREAFDSAGITSQEDRKLLAESVVFREVRSLNDLHAVEARRVLARIRQRSIERPRLQGSAWDTREEDTWIDRL